MNKDLKKVNDEYKYVKSREPSLDGFLSSQDEDTINLK